ncbi:MAG: RNA polymerase sigma factor, partial [Anaerolineae bacterium]|nr:RNA polymerase sigma factor [Anaerolineae bacterium]
MQSPFDDIAIMRQIARQDQQAFHALYQAYGKSVYSLAYHVLQNTGAAEEVTQDTFLKVWQHRATWDPNRGQLKNWLLTIAHFTAIDRLRRERRQPNLILNPLDELEEELTSASAEWLHDGTILRLLVKQLPPEQAVLIQMAFFHGMSHGEIAEATQIPLGTVKTRLRSGLQRLRDIWLDSKPSASNSPQPDV